MIEDIPSYDATYVSKDIPPDELNGFVQEVSRKLGSPALSVEVDLNRKYKKNVYSGRLGDYQRAYSRYPGDIRKFRLRFYDSFQKTHECPYIEMTVRRRGRKDSPSYPKIDIWGRGCSKPNFIAFLEIAEGVLGLAKYPGTEHCFEDSVIAQDYKRTLGNPLLRSQIEASIGAHQYDAALRSASAIIEDELRKKCLAAEKPEAANQSAKELAVTAFHKDTGCLRPPWPLATEAEEGAMLMFMGFFSYLRNAFIHNTTVMGDDRSGVFDCLMTCEFLLRIVEKSTSR